MPDPSDDCLFCKIVAGEVPAEIVHATESTVAFKDVAPQAPTHVLVVPDQSLPECSGTCPSRTLYGSRDVAGGRAGGRRQLLEENYRLVFNTGKDAGQTVFHAHLHVLGGRSLTWPPG